MVCRGICVKYKVGKLNVAGNHRYFAGQKRCSLCGIFIKWEGNLCPCCGLSLRIRPRNTKNRQKLEELKLTKRM